MNILLICLKIIVDVAYCTSVREMTPFLEHGMVDENRHALPQACDRLTFRATAGGSIAFLSLGRAKLLAYPQGSQFDRGLDHERVTVSSVP